MKKIMISSALAGALLLTACSSKPLMTDRDVLVAQNRGELQTMYEQIQQELELEKPSSERAANLRHYHEMVGEKIANEKEARILNGLDRDLEKQTISRLQQAKYEAKALQSYSEKVYLGLVVQLDAAINEKLRTVQEKRNQFDQLGFEESAQKVQLLEDIAKIHGGEKALATQKEKQAYIDSLYTRAKEAMAQTRYDDVAAYLNQLDIVSPEYPEAKALRYKMIAAEYQQQFWDALSAGEKQQSFKVLRKLTDIPNYLESNPDIAAVAEDLARVYVDDGDKQMQSMSIVGAYGWYSKANFIYGQLGKAVEPSEGQKKLLTFVETKAEKALAGSNYLPAYGYLSILAEFNPEHPLLEDNVQPVNNQMLQAATIKLVPQTFTVTEGDSAFAKALLESLREQLPKKSLGRMQFVEQALVNEKAYNVDAISQKANANAFYLLSGEVLKQQLNSQSKTWQETTNELISHKKVENPEYLAWLELSKRKQKEKAQPPAIIEQPVHKDIVIEKTEERRVLEVSVSYRIKNAQAKVQLADALNEKIEVSDVSHPAVEEGLYQLPENPLELPEKAQLLHRLARQMAETITAKAAQSLPEYEKAYAKQAYENLAAKAHNKAYANFAYAVVLQQSKAEVDSVLLEQMRKQVLYWK